MLCAFVKVMAMPDMLVESEELAVWEEWPDMSMSIAAVIKVFTEGKSQVQVGLLCQT